MGKRHSARLRSGKTPPSWFRRHPGIRDWIVWSRGRDSLAKPETVAEGLSFDEAIRVSNVSARLNGDLDYYIAPVWKRK